MVDFLLKLLEFIADFLWKGKIKQLQIKVNRLDISNENEVQDFIELYDETFPYDGSNYTSGELLETLEDIQNKKKHVSADNIILVAKYRDSLIGFIACFYYPQKQYGIIGYIGRSKIYAEEAKYVTVKLLKKLKSILMKIGKCKLIVFELEPQKKEKAKAFLFKRYAKKLELIAYELDFNYYRPKLNLEDEKKEEKLSLLIVPINEHPRKIYSKKKVIEILNFIHCYCYGDYYEKKNSLHLKFQDYMKSRLDIYETSLPDKIKVLQ